jgi:chromosomal replication initiation ATPase DnaA
MTVSQPPSHTPQQLALDLALPARLEAEDFLVGPSNDSAYGMIESWPGWSDPVLRLEGPEGAGKTHLAAIWAARAHAWRVLASDVTRENAPHLVSSGALVVEDADRLPCDETALFHLLNLAREHRAGLILTARNPLDQWGLKTPDLISRLRLAPLAVIDLPDDGLLRAVLVKLFLDRQLVIDTSVIDYLAVHLERSFAALGATVDALDKAALSAGRRVTRALAADFISTRDDEAELLT